MPDFWQFPTVSMGLGPLMAIYQARFLRYLHGRGLADTERRKVWVFCGDGEMDEPELLGAISLAGRERLDNLIFVINCNLQRLDGPVRGNGKIVQELEADFRGAGWNVIKCLWGSGWDELLAKDADGKLRQLMEECVDGEYQDFKSKDGAYIRKHFFGRYAETAAMVEDWSDAQIWALTRGGHDPIKVYAAYKAAVDHKGQPTVILAKTVKGYGMGAAGEGQMIAHQAKKLGDEALKAFRDRFQIPVSDDELHNVPFLRFPEDSAEMKYLRERRAALGGYLPSRRRTTDPLPVPPLSAFDALLKATGEGREISTTMAFVRILTALLRDKDFGPRVVPIVPDESRTFGMEGLFRQVGIFSQVGQLYRPQDADQLMYYREDSKGQILQEGINEPGAMASFIAAGTSYSTSNVPMVPFYIYYSMFGFQRVGDLAWAAGDMRTRGFLIGGTSGRTTLNGEGLQHEDGHSHVLASTIPNCVGYDPTYAYELAVIVHAGLKRMLVDNEDVYYYITTLNENYAHPAMPEGAEEGILRGAYKLRDVAARTSGKDSGLSVRLLGSGAILREVEAAAEMLAEEHGVSSEVWSVTSFTELRREGLDAERWSMLHPEEEPRIPYITRALCWRQGAGDRLDRLHEGRRRRGAALCAGPLQGAGDGRLRPLRLPAAAALVLRGRPVSRGGGEPEGAGRRSASAEQARGGGDQQVRHRPGRTESGAQLILKVPFTSSEGGRPGGENRRQRPGYRRLQGRAGHRSAGEARRHGQGRSVADHPRIRQGDHGRAVDGRRHGGRRRDQGWRQGVDGDAHRADRRGWGRRCGRARGRAGESRGRAASS